MAKDKPLTIEQADLNAWAKEKGIPADALKDLREKVEAKEVDKDRGKFWRRIMWVLGIGAAVGTGAYVTYEAVEAMPETAALVAKRELGERGELMKAKAEEVQKAAGVLIEKVEAFVKAIPASATNIQTLETGAMAFLHGALGDLEEVATGKNMSPDQTLHSMNEFLSADPALAPYWQGVSAAFDDLKKKGVELTEMKGAFDVTDTDKAQAWEDYKKVLWGNIKSSVGLQASKVPTSAPTPESQE